ncbi:hypothetical protein OVA06_03660 [Pseudarthrobacter sp. SL88]|uniref:hypothetical protein n=1 Tax=Pseudarthrobacter sp. SL88 TaxID=2994666 RepID=UPI002272EA72|nr:hypothetical protein [Pseudarthrobacter sp. SL88]MCY1673819.1 hypothetical protein [Pseudarthrobacter sp. SL88]
MLTCAAMLSAGFLFAAPAANAASPATARTIVPASHTDGTAVPASTTSVSALPGQTGQQLARHRVPAKGRALLEAPAAAALTLDAPVTAADLTAHELVLTLDYLHAVQNVGTAATLSKVAVATGGTEAAPATVAQFLAPSVPAVLIPVPANPPSPQPPVH